MTFQLFKKFEKKKLNERQERVKKIMDEVLDVMQKNNTSLSEMSDVFSNLNVNFHRMLLDEVDKLKKDAGHT